LFDDPSNLEILPKSISAEELRDTMRGFSQGTGSRCSTCHVGEVEADLGTYDFTLDDKEMKLKAREMIQLVNSINEQIAAAFPHATETPVQVTCATCHRGQAKPEMIEDILTRTVADNGLDAGVQEYRELRKRYHGGYTFDFSEPVLVRIAENYGVSGNYEAALGFVNLNLEFFPESSRTYVLRAQVRAETGDVRGARGDYRKALEIQPNNEFIRRQLATLE
jgi:tetratricopeptide (TPR) repeat protein